MMRCTALLSNFLFILCCQNSYSSPITNGIEDIHIATAYLPSYTTVLISLGALLLLAYFILGCVCCPNKSIKALSYQNGFPVSRLNENNFENQTEITIFPPHSTVIDLQPVSQSFPGFDDRVTFEPLPDILPKKCTTGQSAACSSRPAHFSALLKSKVSLHDWFDDPNSNFPREQLQYLQELGLGWFGRVVEGEASQICDNEEKTPVIVKILREEASPSEHLHFLHEVRPYRDLNHSNVIKLLGRCLESDPFLLIMEHSICDLKTYLVKLEKGENFLQDGLMLQMISNIASGLRYMHDKGFCHMDLAAHNCFVCNDNSVKIGDYGVSFDLWKNDYYCLGDIALPIRWYSPEILRCSETTIETKEITKEANVWAFGITLWEMVELGKLPYDELNDEEVLQKVLIEKSIQLSPPVLDIICKDEIVLVMRECWKPRKYRPSMEKIESFISQLYNDRLNIKNKELSFEERWNSIQPRITEISSYTGTESSSMKFENDFSTRSDIQNYSSDNEILSSFEMSFDMLPKSGFSAQLSPSLNVLNGSIDELTENDAYLNSISLSCGKYDADTLSNVSDKENFQMEEDKENFHSNNVISEQISAALRDLDLVLASQPDCSRNSTLQKSKPELHDSEAAVEGKDLNVNGILVESQYLSKSSDLSNISENSYSKSSNFSEHLNQLAKEKNSDASVNSDLNGNCKISDEISQEHSNVNKTVNDSENYTANCIILNNNQNISNLVKDINDSLSIEKNVAKLEFEHSNSSSISDNKLSSVPDIVIHESPSLVNVSEIFEETSEAKSDPCIVQNGNQQKLFRFVFKEVCEQKVATTNQQDFSHEIAHDLAESLKKSDTSTPLTSTPVKSSFDSIPSYEIMQNSNIDKNNSSDEVFLETAAVSSANVFNVEKVSNSVANLDSNNKSPDVPNVDSFQETINSTDVDHFTTAQSSLCLSNTGNFTDTKISEIINLNEETCINHSPSNVTLNFTGSKLAFNPNSPENFGTVDCSTSDTFYISADSNALKEHSQVFPDVVISPPNEYSHKESNFSDIHNDIENDYLEDSKASETVSPPQAFQDDGLGVLNDSYSESKTSFDQDFSTSAECGSSENLDQYLEDDHMTQANVSAAKLLETSFPDMESKSFTYESCADFSGNMRPTRKNSLNLNFSDSDQRNSKLYNSDYVADSHHHLYKNMKAPIQSYDQMIVEDLDTGEQTVINESYSVCDDYENSGESDEILKIDTETDEAIIVDSSEALIGFVPSRSIELLQEIEVIPSLGPSYTVDEEKESSDSMNIDAYNSASPSPAAMKHNSSPYESPEPVYPQPYRNFCLQNEVIEEEITDEIVSPSSFHSSSSYCSNDIFMEEEKMSQSSESVHHGEMYETSVLPSIDHLYVVSDDGSKTDVSSSECSPVKQNEVINAKYKTDAENNHIDDDQEDVMHSYQPTQSVRWLSEEMLDVDADDQSPIIIEGQEILAGDIIQTCELTAADFASALSQLESKGHLHGLNPNHLNVSPSPSPFSSVESSPCRDAYTPDFESDSEETNSGTSCSSTSGSFECIHNKFKNTVDISKIADESDKSASSREQSPMKIFSKTWDCHATPTRGVLVTPEKKFNSMRKSVSFHEEDPQVVFEYPPASDSSEDGYPSDDNEEYRQNIDYLKYADWELQACDTEGIEAEDIVEIEELDSEPYVRRPSYSSLSVGPLNRPMLYTLTSGFSDEEFDLSETVPPFSLNAPSNSPDEEKFTMSSSELGKLIQSQLKELADKEAAKAKEDTASSQNSGKEDLTSPMMSVQESVVSTVAVEDIIVEELLPDSRLNYENVTVQEGNEKYNIYNLNSNEDEEIEEIIIEDLSDDDSVSGSFEFIKEHRPIVLDTDSTFSYEREFTSEAIFGKIQVDKKENNSNLENSAESSVVAANGDLKHVGETLSSVVENTLNSNKNCSELLEDVGNQQMDFNSLNNSKTVLQEELVLSHDFVSQDILIHFDESTVQKNDCVNASDFTKNMHSDLTFGSCNFSDLKSNLTENPVHDLSHNSSCIGESSTEVLKSDYHDSESVNRILPDEDKQNSETFSHVNKTSEKKENVTDTVSASFVQDTSAETDKTTSDVLCSREAISSPEKNENGEHSGGVLKNHIVADAVVQSEVAIDSQANPTGAYENLGNYNSALTKNFAVVESSISIADSVAQNDIQSKNSSNYALTNQSEVFSTNDKVADVQSTQNSILCNSEMQINCASDCKKEEKSVISNNVDELDNSESLLHVPKIIVTPASESEVEDELEEFLRAQLENYHSDPSPGDFSVTSEFSCKPFDDVFGSYISGEPTDYIEAFNFEFENGFFEDYGGDYPQDMQTSMNDRLYPDDGRQKRSSSLPLMTENLSDDDSLTIKSDSSLIYDDSKGITRL